MEVWLIRRFYSQQEEEIRRREDDTDDEGGWNRSQLLDGLQNRSLASSLWFAERLLGFIGQSKLVLPFFVVFSLVGSADFVIVCIIMKGAAGTLANLRVLILWKLYVGTGMVLWVILFPASMHSADFFAKQLSMICSNHVMVIYRIESITN